MHEYSDIWAKKNSSEENWLCTYTSTRTPHSDKLRKVGMEIIWEIIIRESVYDNPKNYEQI